MNVSCPHCQTVFRVDPSKVPTAGVKARCSQCAGIFPVQGQSNGAPPAAAAPEGAVASAGAAAGSAASPASSPAAAPSAPAAPVAFGAADPHSKARRLARALISDIVVYHPERRDRSLQDGTLRQEFREEIRKSWEEYSSQVGGDFARETPYFRDALNEILARGERIF